MAFEDLEKAFDRVPQKVIWWALRKLGVEEWIVRLVQGRVLINSRFGVSYSNFSFLTPTFWKVSIEKYGKTPNFFWTTAF